MAGGIVLFYRQRTEQTFMEFEELELIQPILRAVREEGYFEPSPIQRKAIPPASTRFS